MLLLELLLQPAVQRRVADATLSLTERALLQAIRATFDIPVTPTEPPASPPPASPSAAPSAAPPASPPVRDTQREGTGPAASAAASSGDASVAGGAVEPAAPASVR